MTTTHYYDIYLEAKVHSASPLQLVCMAYDCAIEVTGEAREHLRQRRIHERARAITQVMKILNELKEALDYARGGDMSLQLARLYAYMQDRLREANFRQIEEPLIEVQDLLGTLAEAWKQIAATEPVPAAPPVTDAEPQVWMQPVEEASYVGRAYSF